MPSEGWFESPDGPRALQIRRVATARRMRLLVDPRDGAVRLTLPPRASERRARLWAESHRAEIERLLAAIPRRRAIVPGAEIPFRGETLALAWDAAAPRRPVVEDGRLRLGGARESVERRTLAWLRATAHAVLEEETRAIAARAGVTVGTVGVGDPRTRWGSCSARGDIRYAWRLILAPRFVLTATVAHEVAHRLHMDHSPAFRDAERRLLGADPAPARAWLRAHGAELYRLGAG